MKVSEIKKILDDFGIEYSSSMRKGELLQLLPEEEDEGSPKKKIKLSKIKSDYLVKHPYYSNFSSFPELEEASAHAPGLFLMAFNSLHNYCFHVNDKEYDITLLERIVYRALFENMSIPAIKEIGPFLYKIFSEFNVTFIEYLLKKQEGFYRLQRRWNKYAYEIYSKFASYKKNRELPFSLAASREFDSKSISLKRVFGVSRNIPEEHRWLAHVIMKHPSLRVYCLYYYELLDEGEELKNSDPRSVIDINSYFDSQKVKPNPSKEDLGLRDIKGNILTLSLCESIILKCCRLSYPVEMNYLYYQLSNLPIVIPSFFFHNQDEKTYDWDFIKKYSRTPESCDLLLEDGNNIYQLATDVYIRCIESGISPTLRNIRSL